MAFLKRWDSTLWLPLIHLHTICLQIGGTPNMNGFLLDSLLKPSNKGYLPKNQHTHMAMGQKPEPPVSIPTKIDQNGWCTHPKMVPLVLTHTHIPLLDIWACCVRGAAGQGCLRVERPKTRTRSSSHPASWARGKLNTQLPSSFRVKTLCFSLKGWGWTCVLLLK